MFHNHGRRCDLFTLQSANKSHKLGLWINPVFCIWNPNVGGVSIDLAFAFMSEIHFWTGFVICTLQILR